MMSHYGLPFGYDDRLKCGALALSIETLAGTVFEIKASPNDTIMSIKSKIQKVEGIPVSEQHLLYNLKELENSAFVRDYSIQNGATLKLVLSMRGGPVTTKRLPPVDELAWRDLQELIAVTKNTNLIEKVTYGSRVTVLVFRDGDEVNLLRVLENDDGSLSPLSEPSNGPSSGPSVRKLFAEEDPEESEKRLKENSVTMGKMQELREKLERLSIQRKEKKKERPSVVEASGPGGCQATDVGGKEEMLRRHGFASFPSGDYSRGSSVGAVVRRGEQEGEDYAGGGGGGVYGGLGRLTCGKATMAALTRARKESEDIIWMQSNLSVLVDTESRYGVRRTPLPDIRRSPRAEKEEEKKEEEEIGKNLREKTTRSFAIVEEENELASGPSICSSQSSLVALPSSEEVAIACSGLPREGVGRSRFRVSRYVLDSEERPKTTPGKLDKRERKRGTHIFSTSNVRPRATSKSQADVHGEEKKSCHPKKRASTLLRSPSHREESFAPPPRIKKLPPPVANKRLRCSHCKKKLNITNTHTCRCGRMFCALHRYSEAHSCLFDYKEEGKRILQQTNPLVAASKLPKL